MSRPSRHRGAGRLIAGLPAMTAGLLAAVLAGCQSEYDGAATARVARAGVTMSSAAGVTQHRVWAGDRTEFYLFDISPRGTYLSVVDWATLNLAVLDLRTGAMYSVTDGGRGDRADWEEAGVSAFSPDGRRIAYGWQRSDGPMQLRWIELEPHTTGAPSVSDPVILETPQFAPFYPFDWSPDGDEILVLGYPGGSATQLALVSATDGTRTVLKSFDWREPLLAEFSPDGRYVAYDFLPEVDSPNRDLQVVSVDGGYEATIVDHPATDRLLGWHPDGSILFHSDRGDTPGIWRLPMAEGEPTGPAERVKGDVWTVEPLGFAGDDFYYGIGVNPPRFYTAPIDLEKGAVGTPVAVDDPTRVQIRAWDWSADGKLLAYAGSTAGERAALFGRGALMVVIRTDKGEELQTLQLDLVGPGRVRWAPDGESLFVWARDPKDRRGFHRIHLDSGSYETVLRGDVLGDPPLNGHFAISPDGTKLWFVRRDGDAREGYLTLVEHDFEAGTLRPVTPIEPSDDGSVAVSPDGSRLAIVAPRSPRGAIGTIPVEGGTPTELFRVPPDTRVMELDWTHDGAAIVFSTLVGSDPETELKTWALPASGGAPRLVRLPPHVNPREMSLRPDGGRIGFLAGETRGEVWVMEGLGTEARSRTQSEASR